MKEVDLIQLLYDKDIDKVRLKGRDLRIVYGHNTVKSIMIETSIGIMSELMPTNPDTKNRTLGTNRVECRIPNNDNICRIYVMLSKPNKKTAMTISLDGDHLRHVVYPDPEKVRNYLHKG